MSPTSRRILGACFDAIVIGGLTFLLISIWMPSLDTSNSFLDRLPETVWMAILFIAPPLVAVLVGIWRYRATRPDVERRSQKCDYILRGLTVPRCPECGTPFDLKLKSDSGDQH